MGLLGKFAERLITYVYGWAVCHNNPCLFFIKWAVRNGIREAHGRMNGEKSLLQQLWGSILSEDKAAE